jgi:hypothetical protein
MAHEIKALDVTQSPELLRLAEEVRDTQEPCCAAPTKTLLSSCR